MKNTAAVNSHLCPAPGPDTEYPRLEDLKKKYEFYTMAAAQMPLVAAQLSAHKMFKKSTVRQIVSMFDGKTSQSTEADKEASRRTLPALHHSARPKPTIRSEFQTPQNCNTFFVSEDSVTKLSVKHKVQLYNQFINGMTEQSPIAVKADGLMEASVKKSEIRGEVVNEKQAPVKHLLAKLEANCIFPRQKVSPLALQRTSTGQNDLVKSSAKAKPPVKAKEFEDLLEKPANRISTLTVKLRPCKLILHRVQKSESWPRYRTGNKCGFKRSTTAETSLKRNNKQMRYSLPFEAYAPPKKIRRTRAERLVSQMFFRSLQLESLFLAWLSEKEQKPNAEEHEQTERVSNSHSTGQLSDEIRAEVENKDCSNNRENAKQVAKLKHTVPKPIPRRKKKRPAPPVPATSSQMAANNFNKAQANDESESGLSLLQKITSDESQADNPKLKSEKEFEPAKPLRPARKKKTRRILTWQTSESSEGTTPFTNSADSDPEIKPENSEKEFLNQPSSEELDSDLLRQVNSPRKVKSAYTLTAFSTSPSPEREDKIKYFKREAFQTWSTTTDNSCCSSPEEKDTIKCSKPSTFPTYCTAADGSGLQGQKEEFKYLKQGQQQNASNNVSPSDVTGMASSIFDSFIDQGFETGSNDMDSPERVPQGSSANNCGTKTSDSQRIQLTSSANKDIGNLACQQPVQFANCLSHQQLCSPITMPLKMRRKSIYDNEPRRSSLAMQVIREDQPLEHHQIPTCSATTRSQSFFANASTPDTPFAEPSSQFWIKCGYFSLSFDILYKDTNRLRLLYNTFSQKSCDNKDLYFGIDDVTFAESQPFDKEQFSKRWPFRKEWSHFWFSTGDLLIPFVGKRVSPDRVQQAFAFLRASIEESSVIRFGVDDVEFSNARETWDLSPKFSMDSNYSMLVGLQSGNSNGLEGRSKYAWPYTKPVRASDVAQAGNDAENFQERNSGRFSCSPFGQKQFSFGASSSNEPQLNQSMRNSEIFGFGYTNESLDHLFGKPSQTLAADNHKIKTHQERVSSLPEKLSTCNDLAGVSCEVLDALQGTPQYLQHLKTIVFTIIKKGRSNGFSSCTFQELQHYMSFLSRYADICLQECSDDAHKICRC